LYIVSCATFSLVVWPTRIVLPDWWNPGR